MKHGGLSHRIAIGVVPLVMAWLMRAWFVTCRVTEHGGEHRPRIEASGNPAIALFWHYSLVYVFYYLRRYSAAVLVSASEDGDYIAELARHLDFETVRGSRNRGGLGALRGLIRVMRSGKHAGIVADGSQGPPRILQAGAVMLASQTGAPIVPMAWSASRCLVFSSWDRTAIPLPFSRISFFFGEPLFVPPNLDAEAIEQYRITIEHALNTLYEEAWREQGKEAH